MTVGDPPVWRARHPDEETRYRAVPQLDASMAAGREELLARLSDSSWRVRSAAVERFASLADPTGVVPALIELLDGAGDVAGRVAAEAALARLGVAALPALLARLASSSHERRLSAVAAIGGIASRQAIPALVACLADPDRALRTAAAETLGKLGGSEAIGPLMAALASDDITLRSAALDALVTLRVVPPLAQLAKLMKDPPLRPGAYRALAASDETEALVLLGGGLAEPGRAARLAALASMGAHLARRPFEALAPLASAIRRLAAGSPTLAEVCAAELGAVEPQVAEGALLVLGWIGELGQAPAVARMAAEERLRPLVERALAGLPAGTGLVEVLGQVLPGLPPVARVVIFAALARAGDAAAFQALLDRVADPDPQVQAEAIAVLGRLERPAGAMVLGGLLDDRSPAVTGLAAEALVEIGRGSEPGRRAVLLECRARAAASGSAALYRVLGGCGEVEDLRLVRRGLTADAGERRMAAAVAVAMLGKRGLLRGADLPELIAALSDTDWPVRVAAAQAFGELAEASSLAMDGLRRALEDPEAPVRAAAVEALGACGRLEHRTAIAALAGSPSAPAQVVVAALRALAKLGPPDPELLRGALAHPDAEVVKAVVAALARVPGEAGRELLRAALADHRWDVRLAAAKAIAVRGDVKLLEEAGRAAAADPDPLVAGALADAALLLAGRPGR